MVPWRPLLRGVTVCLLCGSSPFQSFLLYLLSISGAQKEALDGWLMVFDIRQSQTLSISGSREEITALAGRQKQSFYLGL